MPAGLELGDVRAFLEIDSTRHNSALTRLLAASARFAATYTGRRLEPAPKAAADPPVTVRVRVDRTRVVRVPDAREVTAVTAGGIAVTGWHLGVGHPQAAEDPCPFLHLAAVTAERWLVLTGRFGFDPVPADLQEAILTLVARRHAERGALWADAAGPADDMRSYMRLLPAATRATLDAYRLASDTVGVR